MINAADAEQIKNFLGAAIDSLVAPNGVFSTTADVDEHFKGLTMLSTGLMQNDISRSISPMDWFTTNLQVMKNFAIQLNLEQVAFIRLNTGCNKDGSIKGSTVPPTRFSTLGNVMISSFVYIVRPDQFAPTGFTIKSRETAGRFHNMPLTKHSYVNAIRAESFEDIYSALRELNKLRATVGID